MPHKYRLKRPKQKIYALYLKWKISEAYLKIDEATSSNSYGVGVTVSGEVGIPLIAKGGVSVNANYSHGVNSYNYGEMIPQPGLIGQACRPQDGIIKF